MARRLAIFYYVKTIAMSMMAPNITVIVTAGTRAIFGNLYQQNRAVTANSSIIGNVNTFQLVRNIIVQKTIPSTPPMIAQTMIVRPTAMCEKSKTKKAKLHSTNTINFNISWFLP